MNKVIFIGKRPKFKFTPWYLKLLGYKEYRRKELVPVLIIYDAHNWVYYDREEMLITLAREKEADRWKEKL